jgi:hypothetical protein
MNYSITKKITGALMAASLSLMSLSAWANIGGTVYCDANCNGAVDAGDVPLSGITVNAYICGTTNLVGSTVTAADGSYNFEPSATMPWIPGGQTYYVCAVIPSGYIGSPGSVCTSDCFTFGNPCSCGHDLFLCPVSGSCNPCTGAIGDFVWVDTNGNGCQDAGEPGIPGVQLDLYSGCGSGLIFVRSTTTDSSGHYLFSGLCAGSYTVRFHTPAGYTHTLSHQNCSVGGLPPDQTDSNCECSGSGDCDVCVTLPADNTQDLSIDCGYIPPPGNLSLQKTASQTLVNPGQPVTYQYVVSNIGSVQVDNINIVDDNGTPSDPSDDYLVNPAPFSLAPGQSASFAIAHITEALCVQNGGTNLNGGTLTINVLANGNVEVFYNQSQGLNDNRYGTGATAATGWISKTHKFSDLVGSDEATFAFTDSTGKTVLSFQEDYISQATSARFGDGVTITYPSGYGTLGPLGGDGKMIIGGSSNVLSCRTTFSDSLNQPGFTGFTVNSPPETSPLSNVSIPAGWNYTDGYYVLVSANAFGAAGFGGVSITAVHNSPSKGPIDKIAPTNMCTCVTNVAIASGVAIVGGSSVTVSDSDFEIVCGSGTGGGGSGACNLMMGAIKFDKNTIQIPIKDNGSANVIMNTLQLTWPQATNGKLKTVTLNGPAFNGPAANSPVTIPSAGVNWAPGTNPRTINHGQSKTLVLTFEKNVDTNASHYSGGVASFGADSSCQVQFLP